MSANLGMSRSNAPRFCWSLTDDGAVSVCPYVGSIHSAIDD